ncbi:MAG: nucleotidyltransferase family protein [Candidatus Bathyarchaeota archaeon]|nr:MAG: nucleotidyltransferase family protein [Candidatus Bathyarchaeota archaeon]
MRLAAVVLAAGKSSRMGKNKLLLEVAGRTVLDRLLDALDGSTVDEVFVVLGHRPEELAHIVDSHRAETVMNPNYEDGMTSSFKTGLDRVNADGAFLILGDQLGLQTKFLALMADRMENDADALIVSPVHDGKSGHPVLFRRALFAEILGLGPDKTVRDVVRRHEVAHVSVEGDIWCNLDMDTPKEFERIRRLFESHLSAGPR